MILRLNCGPRCHHGKTRLRSVLVLPLTGLLKSTELDKRRPLKTGSPPPNDENLDAEANEPEAASRLDASSMKSSELERTIDVPPPPFRFLHLPPEIRNMVYELVVVDHSPLTTKIYRRVDGCLPIDDVRAFQHKPSEETRFWGHSRLALLATCREAYFEARTLYYRENSFSIVSYYASEFIQAINEDNQNQLRSLFIDCTSTVCYDDSEPAINMWNYLEQLQKLSRLTLFLPHFEKLANQEQSERDVYWKGVERLKALRRFGVERRNAWYVDIAILDRDREDEQRVNDFLAKRNQEQSAVTKTCLGQQDTS